jgi:PST family polysaccharide transporter
MEGAQAVVGALSILAFALSGLGYWALVLGRLVAGGSWTAMVLWHRRHAFARPRLRSLREPVTFSSHLLVSRLAWYAQSNSDFLVAGRVFGKALLGAYSMAFTLASLPNEKITSMVGRVAYPLFAAIQDDVVALRRYVLLLTKGLALLTFPMAFGMALVADVFVLGVLGQQWESAIAPLRCLALLILVQSVVSLIPHVLNVTGESRFGMRVGVVSAVVMPLAFYLGSRWGLVGIAVMWLTIYPLTRLPLYWRAFRKLRLSPLTYGAVLWPALSACLAMSAAVLTLRLELPDQWPLLATLIAEVVAGAAVYALIIFTVHRHHLLAFRKAMEHLRAPASA